MSDAGTAGRERGYVLAVLTLTYAFSIADRFSIATVIDPIRAELGLSDAGVAAVSAVAIGVIYVTLGIPVAAYADAHNRRNLLALALAVWSGMTTLCGFAQNSLQLVLARLGVGLGEAGGTPPSTSMLADKFEPERRPFALTVYALGACLGAWLGSSVAGAAAERAGWRAAFLVLGIPGLLLAFLIRLSVREPPRGALDGASRHDRSTLRETLRFVRSQRSAVHLLLGGGVATLWSWGLMWWTPSFLQRSHHLSVGEAGALLGPMHLVAGTAGTLVAAWLVSRPAARDPRYIVRLLAAVVALTTVPSFLAYAVHSRQLAQLCLWLFVPGVYFYIGPILGLLQNVTPPHMRASACALLLLVANVGNLVIAPLALGWLSDSFRDALGAGPESLRWALLILAPTGLWAAWHLWTSGRTIRADATRISSPA
ncbi:MAG: MFS transporter [Proteobacteria bacterium]|nr:MFS transporter [Pseudomonadota bacterium]